MDEFFLKILGDQKVASTGELSALKTLQARWLKARDLLNASTDSAAKTAFAQHLRELSGSIAAGEDSPPEFSWESWQQKFATRMAASKQAMHLVCVAAIPLASRACEAFCRVANDLATEQEKREAAQHAVYGIPYTPSGLVSQLKRAAQMARGRIPANQEYASTSPRAMLPYLDI